VKHLESELISDPESDDSIEMYQISVKAAKSRQDKILMPIKVNGTSIQMEFDPGAGASIISKEKFDSLFPKVTLRPPDIVLRSVFSESKRPIGYFQCLMAFNDKEVESANLYVVEGNVESIIGRPWLRSLGIIDKYNNIHLNLHQVKVIPLHSQLKDILKKYESLFDGKIGTVADYQCSLKLRDNENPVYLKP